MFRHAIDRGSWTSLYAIMALALAAYATSTEAILKGMAVDPCNDSVGEGRVLLWSSEPEIATALANWAKRTI